MNRTQLKYFVIVAMLVDHIAWAFVPTASPAGQIMHFFGRLTAPTMAFFLAEGYEHTRNIKKYVLRMGLFALLSWIPFVYFEFGRLPVGFYEGRLQFIPVQGVIYTLFLGLLAIWLWDKGKCSRRVKILGIAGLCLISMIGDWAAFVVLWSFFFYLYRDSPRKKWRAFAIVGLVSWLPSFVLGFLMPEGIWWSTLYNAGIFVAPFLLQRIYNGEPGRKNAMNKWFFYVFYPLHLLILGILAHVVL